MTITLSLLLCRFERSERLFEQSDELNERSERLNFKEEITMAMEYNWTDDFKETYNLKFTTPEKYIKRKLQMLKRDMRIALTDEELAHLNSLKTEGDINRAVSTIIDNHWS